MRVSARQLFSTYPAGLAGAGLLLLRAVIGLVLVLCPHHTDGLVAAGGVLILIGLLTPIAGVAMAGTMAGSQYVSAPRDLPELSVVLLVAGCLALVLLGPGGWSVDSWLFGRREIVIPRRRG
jgi:hypothetical protein